MSVRVKARVGLGVARQFGDIMAQRFDHLGTGHAYAPGAAPEGSFGHMHLFEMGVDGPVLVLLGLVVLLTLIGILRFAGRRRIRYDPRVVAGLERRQREAEQRRIRAEPRDFARALLNHRMRPQNR